MWETFPFAWFKVSKDSMINFKSSVKHKHTYMYDMKSWWYFNKVNPFAGYTSITVTVVSMGMLTDCY